MSGARPPMCPITTLMGQHTQAAHPAHPSSDLQTSDNNEEKMETLVPMTMTTDPEKMFGQEPEQIQCSNCHQQITTRVEARVRVDGLIRACCCCLFCCFWLASLLVTVWKTLEFNQLVTSLNQLVTSLNQLVTISNQIVPEWSHLVIETF